MSGGDDDVIWIFSPRRVRQTSSIVIVIHKKQNEWFWEIVPLVTPFGAFLCQFCIKMNYLFLTTLMPCVDSDPNQTVNEMSKNVFCYSVRGCINHSTNNLQMDPFKLELIITQCKFTTDGSVWAKLNWGVLLTVSQTGQGNDFRNVWQNSGRFRHHELVL